MTECGVTELLIDGCADCVLEGHAARALDRIVRARTGQHPGSASLVDVFAGRSQVIVYRHMWTNGAEWQCGGCTGFRLAGMLVGGMPS